MGKSPRFFCDNCGVEVDRNAKACSRCGRFFAQIRCPSCGFTGEEKTFVRGCPSCGYSAPQPGIVQSSKIISLIPAGKLPPWVYVLSICTFLGVCVLLAIIVLR